MTLADTPTVLIVEDEQPLASLYAAWLDDGYRTRVANGGGEALDALDGSVDIVLLDRRMPDMSGTEVLSVLRERELDCQVAMVTAVEPSADELALGFDDYLLKPIDRSDLTETVEALAARREYPRQLQEYFQLVSKQASLASIHPTDELDRSEEYRRQAARIARIEDELEPFDDLAPTDFQAAMRGPTQAHLRQASRS